MTSVNLTYVMKNMRANIKIHIRDKNVSNSFKTHLKEPNIVTQFKKKYQKLKRQHHLNTFQEQKYLSFTHFMHAIPNIVTFMTKKKLK